MNIYLRMVIAAREYHAKLLLGVIATARGHRVLLGELPKLAGRLPAGLYHTNDLNVRKAPHIWKLARAGFVITAHDEEHGLNDRTFDNTLRNRFSTETMEYVSASFAWGRWDHDALRASFPERADVVMLSGSPRVDLWRPELGLMRALGTAGTAPTVQRARIVIASNFGPQPTPLWNTLGATRAAESGVTLEARLAQLHAYEGIQGVATEFVAAIHALSRAFPQEKILVRPHPTETWGALAELIGSLPNVVVRRDGTITEAIQAADVLVHNGSTSGIEAAIAGTPSITYVPRGLGADWFTNSLGRRATGLPQLIGLVEEALSPDGRTGWYDAEQSAHLSERIHRPAGVLASQVMVDRWEELMQEHRLDEAPPMPLPGLVIEAARANARERRRRRAARPTARAARADERGSEVAELVRDESVRFPRMQLARVRRDAEALSDLLGAPHPQVVQVGPRLVHLRPRSGT